MSKNVSKNWKVFKERFVEVNEGVNPDVLDYIAVEDILLSHLSGYSLDRILEIYQLSKEYVIIVLEEFIKVSPRENALDFNPYNIYKNTAINKQKFINLVRKKSTEDALKLYDACTVLEKISEEIDDFYLKEEEQVKNGV